MVLRSPVSGVHYPGDLAAVRSWFPDDAACLDYLDWLRWPNGFRCPPSNRLCTTTAPSSTSSRIARSTVSVDFLCIRRARVDRAGIRAPDVCPNRNSTAYSRTAASLIAASNTHSGSGLSGSRQ